MLIISIVSQLGTKEEEIIPKLSELTNYKIINDDYIVSLIKNNLGYSEKKITRYLFAPSGLISIDKIKRLQFLALFRMYLGKTLLDGEKIFTGFGTYLLPREAKGILRLCFGANINFRIGNYAKSKRIPIEFATKKVKEFDRNLFFFTKTYLKKTPYEPNDFHFNIDVEKYKTEEIINKILELVHNWNYDQGEDIKTILQDYVIENRILAIFLGEKEDIDGGDFMLASFVDRIREIGIDLFITGVNDSVMDSMKRTLLYYKIGDDHFFRNVAQAVDALWESSHCFSDEEHCPLKKVVYE